MIRLTHVTAIHIYNATHTRNITIFAAIAIHILYIYTDPSENGSTAWIALRIKKRKR